MSPEQILARERRVSRPVAAAALAAAVAFVAAIVVNQSAGVTDTETDAEFLVAFADSRVPMLVASLLQAAGMVLVIPPLFYLFQAASARSERMRSSLIGITVAGPLFLATGVVLQWVAFDNAASEFAGVVAGDLDVPIDEHAENLIQDQAVFDAAQGFTFAGTLGFVIGVVYTALHAMRVGLLTRFWGSLGMALGVSLLFLGFIGILVFVVALGLLILGAWPGGRPAAWESGTAIPWPKPGQEAREEPVGSSDSPQEPADPDDLQDPAALPQDPAALHQDPAELARGSAGEGSAGEGFGPAPRKRKRRDG